MNNPALKNNYEFEINPIIKADVRYDLSSDELIALEASLMNEVQAIQGVPGVAAAWIGPDHPYSNILRSYEVALFPEVANLPQDIEDRSLFLALVDSRPGIKRIIHSTTISGVTGRKIGERLHGDETGETVTSGFIIIDDLIEMGNFSKEEFWDYYSKLDINLQTSLSVETNNRVGERVDDFEGMRTTDIAYLLLFNLLTKRNSSGTNGVVFANINTNSIKSFERFGIECNALMGRTDLVTSESMNGLDYTPVAIPDNAQLFAEINLKIPQLFFNTNVL